ncbi:hypothetical protein G7Y89_g1858 [Cudoniella acicularis]|uniref:Uncharacterized protein n=1 Tax=Cudoniella acicularis TaxID=354080 RepID=A0A8H4RVA7_9HELO|nr:hypothetical protein G7Y89_g1858 [Cudoniella acicularis]
MANRTTKITYGKRRHSLFPSFSVLRDSDSASKSKKDKSTSRGSTITLSAFHDSKSKDNRSSHHDDSIDEMVSYLLDDTTVEQLREDPGKRLSQISVPNELSSISPHIASPDDKGLPQLPNLIFNGDDAWAMRSTPVVIAIGSFNEIQFNSSFDELNSIPPSIAKHPSNHLRKSSAPPIPRKSSKRKSARSKSIVSSPRKMSISQPISQTTKGLVTSISTPVLLNAPEFSTTASSNHNDINRKVEAMLAATAKLKPSSSDNGLLHGSLVSNKPRRMKDTKVIVKVKTAINDRWKARQSRKAHDSVRDDKLLDPSINGRPSSQDDLPPTLPALNIVEVRLNEGQNFRKREKIQKLTGHGNVARKALADEGRSLRSRPSLDDPFSERPCSSQRRTPTGFEQWGLREDMSLDLVRDEVPEVPSLPRSYTDLPQIKRSMHSTTAYDKDFDDLLSSSPDAQSTPRIRLEPSFEENGKRTLKHPELPAIDPVKRMSSQITGLHLEADPYFCKRMKKHPSPSKAELEQFEQLFSQQHPELFLPEYSNNGDEIVPTAIGHSSTAPALALKDPNQKMAELDNLKTDYACERSQAVALNRSTDSMPDFSRRAKIRRFSLMPRFSDTSSNQGTHTKRDSWQYPGRKEYASDSEMDIDELQMDESAYRIGTKR